MYDTDRPDVQQPDHGNAYDVAPMTEPASPSSSTTTARVSVRLEHGPIVVPPEEGATEGGASCRFVGITRPETDPDRGPLRALEYEACEDIALEGMRELATSIADRHRLHRITMVHALGTVPVGEASVLIEVLADHRAQAFDGCRQGIDRLKAEIPIWKRECWRDGATWSSSTRPLPQSIDGSTD